MAKSKKPKLPNLFVGFRGDMARDIFYLRPRVGQPGVNYTVHKYAPVQKPKVCVWTRDGDRFTSACKGRFYSTYWNDGAYCPNCGGKIRRKS